MLHCTLYASNNKFAALRTLVKGKKQKSLLIAPVCHCRGLTEITCMTMLMLLSNKATKQSTTKNIFTHICVLTYVHIWASECLYKWLMHIKRKVLI